jgi:hypothetical protein
MRAWVGVIVVELLLLAAAATARADVTIGSDLATEPTVPVTPSDPIGLTAAQDGVTAPFSGVITRWRLRGSATASVRLRILRPSTGVEVAHSDLEPPPSGGAKLVYESQISIAQGDQIALECCTDGAAGTLFFPGAVTTRVWSPPIGNGEQMREPPTDVRTDAIALNADLEPDRDGDGFGDDTQDDDDDADGVLDANDACPTQAGSSPNGCPPAPQAARVNTPAIVRFRTPLAGTAIGPSQLIELDVTDDFGTPTVTVFDDDGTVCALSGPPYSCTWRPTGADVGRATLLASAVDADNRSSLGSVRVRVSRFEATLTRRVRGRRVSGKLRLPAAVEPALGCDGDVIVRRGRVRRTVALKRNCTYATRLPRGAGRVRVRFGGNPVVAPT